MSVIPIALDPKTGGVMYYFRVCRTGLGAFRRGMFQVQGSSKITELGSEIVLVTNCLIGPELPTYALPEKFVGQLLLSDLSFLDLRICQHAKAALARYFDSICLPPLTPTTATFFQDASKIPALQSPLAIFVLGGLGVGKSTVIEQMQQLLGDKRLLLADADLFRDPVEQPAGSSMRVDTQDDIDSAKHEECLASREQYIAWCVQYRTSLFIPMTGRHYASTEELIFRLRKKGFIVRIIYADAPGEVVTQHIEKRKEETGRGVYGHPSQASTSARHSKLNLAALVRKTVVEPNDVSYVYTSGDTSSFAREYSVQIRNHFRRERRRFPSRSPSRCGMDATSATSLAIVG